MKRFVLTSALLTMINIVSSATHIVGGEFEILHLEGDRYLFRQIQYFDVVNGNPQAKDANVNASIFRKKDNVFVRSILMTYRSESYVPYTNPVCTNDRLITNRIVYSAELVLDPAQFSDPEGYYMVWERCCRNNIITNIVRPNETGQTFYLEFPPIRKNGLEYRNSSPQLFPPLSDYACVNRFYYVDFRGTDPDGDSLVYSLNTPSNSSAFEPLPTPTPAPHPTVTWVNGINSTYQIPGNPTLAINDKGFLTVTPSTEGLFVFSVKCEEFREGTKIGEVVRDFQLFVIDCPDPGIPPEIQVKAPGSEIFVSELDTIILNVDDDKCFDFSIKDKDVSETISISAEPVNFEANLASILSANIGYIEHPQDTLGIQVCLPDCPYLQNEPFIIDVIARDFTCPQPLMDTMRLIVLVEPPPNQPPKFIEPTDVHINATYIEGSVINLAFKAEDKDLDSLLLFVEGEGFNPEDYGIRIDTVVYEDGKIDFNLVWDTDCQVYPFGLKNEFQMKLYVEDDDQCMLDNRDSIILNVTIDLPDNNVPVALIDNEHANKELTVRVEDDLSFDIRGFDGDPTDLITLDAVGMDFKLEDVGISFERQTGNSNVHTELNWQIECDDVNLFQKDSYEILVTVEDEDKCKVPNADSLILTLNILPPENTPPEILVNGEILKDTIFAHAGDLINLGLSGNDKDGDVISMRMNDAQGREDLGILFEPVTGVSSVSTDFSWQTSCSLLGENFEDKTYEFTIFLDDDKCIVPLSDTLNMIFVIRDEKIDYDFLPPNVFTPNGQDEINSTYFIPNLPRNNCERQFKEVTIYNRFGVKVFNSKDRDFHWTGDNHPSGVYYYLISFSDFSVKGTVSIVK
ncbi:MAG: gliding motility-associated C-terminal domain-containing protein [Cytophagales bacterium]|nr:gliding motility-associated C-terminal domain-containing protein [Cytophagales bacterium]